MWIARGQNYTLQSRENMYISLCARQQIEFCSQDLRFISRIMSPNNDTPTHQFVADILSDHRFLYVAFV